MWRKHLKAIMAKSSLSGAGGIGVSGIIGA
jgi:hypothetical protein